MRLEHAFTVPVPVEQAWPLLLDVERIAPCLPGATVDTVEGEEFTGRVKVKVGPIQLTYGGRARFAERDVAARRVVIEARGRETRGSGTAAMTVTARMTAAGGETRVEAVTDLTVTGRPAQFGRGVMADVGAKLLGQFSACLAQRLAGGAPDATGGEPAPPAAAPPTLAVPGPPAAPPATAGPLGPPPPPEPPPPRDPPTDEAIDLLGVAGVPVLKRVAPLLAALAALALAVRWLARRR